jgi:hypothetical protein
MRRIAGCVVALLSVVLLGAVSASASAQSLEVAPKDSVGAGLVSGVAKAQALPPQAVVFSSLDAALNSAARNIGVVEIESEVDSINGDPTVMVDLRDGAPVISIGGSALMELNTVCGHETFTVQSYGLFHQQVLTTRFSLNVHGQLVITVSDHGDENAVRSTFTETTDGQFTVMMASCKCIGSGTKVGCNAARCDAVGACATGPNGIVTATCQWKAASAVGAGLDVSPR